MHGFWTEELRSFPRDSSGGRLWVARCDTDRATATLRLLLAWRWGADRAVAPATAPPLTLMLAAARHGRPALLRRRGPDDPEASARVLRVVPVRATAAPGCGSQDAGTAAGASEPEDRGSASCALVVAPTSAAALAAHEDAVSGAIAVWHEDAAPWGEAVELWLRSCAARLAPILSALPSVLAGHPAGGDGPRVIQPTLFPVPSLPVPGVRRRRRKARRRGVQLPHPICVPGLPGAVGVSRELVRLGGQVPLAAASSANVLIHGESGTGKEIVARALHAGSPRRHGPFVGINCAALPETLFESELFGHKAGAFTGAARDKPGLLEAADRGTFFLDEIGDMPQSLQIKLLRVMQERSVRRVGELDSRPVDIRFVAATHRDLRREVAAGRFRLDLYFRLNVIRLAIPPLRHRPEDVAPLIAYFLRRQGSDPEQVTIAESALAALQAWRWPGNVRELENEVQRWLALHGDAMVIQRPHLSDELQGADAPTVDPDDLATLRPLDQASELLERYLIRKAVAATGGRKAAAARRLGLSRQGLYKKLQRYGMGDLIGPPTVARAMPAGETAGETASRAAAPGAGDTNAATAAATARATAAATVAATAAGARTVAVVARAGSEPNPADAAEAGLAAVPREPVPGGS
ncbi:MAG: sigma 54-interacting transcriptional regulator [Candidatus Krumholzibacteriia bacterium]